MRENRIEMRRVAAIKVNIPVALPFIVVRRRVMVLLSSPVTTSSKFTAPPSLTLYCVEEN